MRASVRTRLHLNSLGQSSTILLKRSSDMVYSKHLTPLAERYREIALQNFPLSPHSNAIMCTLAQLALFTYVHMHTYLRIHIQR